MTVSRVHPYGIGDVILLPPTPLLHYIHPFMVSLGPSHPFTVFRSQMYIASLSSISYSTVFSIFSAPRPSQPYICFSSLPSIYSTRHSHLLRVFSPYQLNHTSVQLLHVFTIVGTTPLFVCCYNYSTTTTLNTTTAAPAELRISCFHCFCMI